MRMFIVLMMAVGMGCAVNDAADMPPSSAEDASTPEPACSGSYVACGCGCCGGVPANEAPCLPCDGGKALQDIIARDKESARSPDCALAGCSFPVKYTYCATSSTSP
ncbi:hypothetical protein F0U62_26375 [Cystobacter fuscus]|uniref:hypothetical protein n=1 Tax=Cystobacter fuscus TaxID=43 RepID=UPI002B2A3E3B|nr:hypothetical protein F0U62_26375 [Cystobacter fuscus]